MAMKRTNKRKICFPITSRVHYARQKYLIDCLRKDARVELQIITAGSVLLDKYAQRFLPAIKEEGLPVHDTLFNVIEGGSHLTMAKTAGLTTFEFASSLHRLNPDIVVIRGDRFEQLAVAIAAAYLNKTIAHIEGGDRSGTIDESVRHAITKLSHIHFVTNEDSRMRIIQMGENPAMVFNVGSVDIEFARNVKKQVKPTLLDNIGVGEKIDLKKPYVMVMYHPVTTEKENREHAETLLRVVGSLGTQVIWFWPNSDAGTDDIAKALRTYREKVHSRASKIHFVTDILPEDFITLLTHTKCLVGNSSAGIKEASYLGVPVVNIGTRQEGRLRGPNVKDVGYSAKEILKAIKSQFAHGTYPSSSVYYKPNASKQIVSILANTTLFHQKRFYDAKLK